MERIIRSPGQRGRAAMVVLRDRGHRGFENGSPARSSAERGNSARLSALAQFPGLGPLPR